MASTRRPDTSVRDLRVSGAGVELAGSLHLPDGVGPSPTLLMVGGSGPTDRDNDIYFPPIRGRLLARGIAVASFDKRGVGGSTGEWHDGGPAELTSDALAELASLREQRGVDGRRVGLFGHSQGGWVVLEAAARDPSLAYVITNSGPGVTPALQERFAVATQLRASGRDDAGVARALSRFDEMVGRIRAGEDAGAFEDLATDEDLLRHTLVPGTPDVLRLMRAWLDHDPRPALERLQVPMLAIFGSADRIVPVAESLAVMRASRAGRPGALTELVIEGGDHRSQLGDPPMLPAGYHRALADWIVAQT